MFYERPAVASKPQGPRGPSSCLIIRHLYSISTTSAAEYSAAASPLAARGATVLGGITTKPT